MGTLEPTPDGPDMPVGRRFVSPLLASAFGFLVLALLFIQLVDPYGVSPIGSRVPGFNEVKPARVDIDRLIKPYEVWATQPRTVFMGTSRIHQSIDPGVLDGTPLWPAYNASIPANNLGMNVSHLEQYIALNSNLERIYVELFIYNFLGQNQEALSQSMIDYAAQAAPLFLSFSAFRDAVSTLVHNVEGRGERYEITLGGNFHYPPGHDAQGPFAGFPRGIWAMHPANGIGPQLSEPSFERIDQLIDLAAANDIELVLLATPNHAYSDYYFDIIDGWDLFAEWLHDISAKAEVLSFSQPNWLVYEPVSADMVYWYDPFHFSVEFGRLMQLSLLGQAPSGTPDNFMVRLTPENVDDHVAARRRAIQDWATENPGIVERIREERELWEAGRGEAP